MTDSTFLENVLWSALRSVSEDGADVAQLMRLTMAAGRKGVCTSVCGVAAVAVPGM